MINTIILDHYMLAQANLCELGLACCHVEPVLPTNTAFMNELSLRYSIKCPGNEAMIYTGSFGEYYTFLHVKLDKMPELTCYIGG